MVSAPTAYPDTIPVIASIEAIAGLLLLHATEPKEPEFVSEIWVPKHTCVGPDMTPDAGKGFTVILKKVSTGPQL